MPTYRAAIIGLTGIAAGKAGAAPHDVLGEAMPFSHAAAYHHCGVEVVGYCDLVAELREGFAETWSERWPAARPYEDWEVMLAETRPDILSVATPDHLHADMVRAACSAGVRAVFCEKPLTTSVVEADQIIAAARASGTIIAVDHSRRWYPKHNEARRQLEAGAIGRLRAVHGMLGGPRAMLFRNGTHLVDMMNFYAGAGPVEVVGRLQPEFAEYGPEYAGDGGHDPATDPGATATVFYANGVVGRYTALQGTMGGVFELDLLGEEGRIRVGSHAAEIWRGDAAGPVSGPVVRPLSWQPPTRAFLGAAVQELIEVLDGMRAPEAMVSTAADARNAVAVLCGILRSHHRGGVPVELAAEFGSGPGGSG